MLRKRKNEEPSTKKKAVARSFRGRLFDDEEVVMVARPSRIATLPKFVFTLGLYTFWRRRDTSVLTDQRVLLGKGILRRTERSIPLALIDDVTFTRSWISSYAGSHLQRATVELREAGRPDDRPNRPPVREGDDAATLIRRGWHRRRS